MGEGDWEWERGVGVGEGDWEWKRGAGGGGGWGEEDRERGDRKTREKGLGE